MDTAARIDAVLIRAGQAKSRAEAAKRAGPPCLKCWHIDGATCGHLAYSDWQFDVSLGRPQEHHSVTIQEARSERGLCGPEALLFERSARSKAQVFIAIAGMVPAGLCIADLARRFAGL